MLLLFLSSPEGEPREDLEDVEAAVLAVRISPAEVLPDVDEEDVEEAEEEEEEEAEEAAGAAKAGIREGAFDVDVESWLLRTRDGEAVFGGRGSDDDE